MYLINAVYFKGIWASKFDKNNTRNEDFRASDGNTNQVQMMRQTANFNYGTDEYGEYLELPYGNKAFNMIVILPQEDKTTEDNRTFEQRTMEQCNRQHVRKRDKSQFATIQIGM
jgi:serpin B